AGEKARRGAGYECKSALSRKIARGPDRKDRHCDQNQPTPEITRTSDRKTKAPPLWGRTDAFGHVPSRQPRTPCAEPPNSATPAFGSTFQWAAGSNWGKITSQQPAKSDERGRAKNTQRIQPCRVGHDRGDQRDRNCRKIVRRCGRDNKDAGGDQTDGDRE